MIYEDNLSEFKIKCVFGKKAVFFSEIIAVYHPTHEEISEIKKWVNGLGRNYNRETFVSMRMVRNVIAEELYLGFKNLDDFMTFKLRFDLQLKYPIDWS